MIGLTGRTFKINGKVVSPQTYIETMQKTLRKLPFTGDRADELLLNAVRNSIHEAQNAIASYNKALLGLKQ